MPPPHNQQAPPNPITLIRPRLYLAPLPSPALLQDLNITHLLTLLTHPLPFALPPRIAHHHLRIPDSPKADLVSHLPALCDWIDAALEGEGNAVMVHCELGRSRSVAVVCAWIMRTEGVGAREAMRDVGGRVKEEGGRWGLGVGFVRQLGEWGGWLEREKERVRREAVERERREREEVERRGRIERGEEEDPEEMVAPPEKVVEAVKMRGGEEGRRKRWKTCCCLQ